MEIAIASTELVSIERFSGLVAPKTLIKHHKLFSLIYLQIIFVADVTAFHRSCCAKFHLPLELGSNYLAVVRYPESFKHGQTSVGFFAQQLFRAVS